MERELAMLQEFMSRHHAETYMMISMIDGRDICFSLNVTESDRMSRVSVNTNADHRYS
jgi:hypothetical protein